MVRLEPDLPEAFMHAGFAPRRAAMGASEEILHGLREVAEGLLLHGLRPGRQPVVLGADHGQLGGLLVVPGSAPPRLPKLLLLHGKFQTNRAWRQWSDNATCWGGVGNSRNRDISEM